MVKTKLKTPKARDWVMAVDDNGRLTELIYDHPYPPGRLVRVKEIILPINEDQNAS